MPAYLQYKKLCQVWIWCLESMKYKTCGTGSFIPCHKLCWGSCDGIGVWKTALVANNCALTRTKFCNGGETILPWVHLLYLLAPVSSCRKQKLEICAQNIQLWLGNLRQSWWAHCGSRLGYTNRVGTKVIAQTDLGRKKGDKVKILAGPGASYYFSHRNNAPTLWPQVLHIFLQEYISTKFGEVLYCTLVIRGFMCL